MSDETLLPKQMRYQTALRPDRLKVFVSLDISDRSRKGPATIKGTEGTRKDRTGPKSPVRSPVPRSHFVHPLPRLCRWLDRQRTDMPAELAAQAERAILNLKCLDLNKRQPAALKAMARLALPEIESFATAYTAWRAGQ